MRDLVAVEFTGFAVSVAAALDFVGARGVLAAQTAILLKPNLINASPPPVTTPAACCEAVIQYIQSCSKAEIVVGEGCGDPKLETNEIFQRLGYGELANRYGVRLVDLNTASLRRLENPSCKVFPEMYLPEMAFTHFLISIPVLKAHSLATITGTLKNLIGLAPPKHYAGRFGSWQKAVFHGNMQQAIRNLNAYRIPDLTVMDASIGLAEYHLGGAHCQPPVRKILAGANPWVVDREAARLLGLDWRSIPHLV